MNRSLIVLMVVLLCGCSQKQEVLDPTTEALEGTVATTEPSAGSSTEPSLTVPTQPQKEKPQEKEERWKKEDGFMLLRGMQWVYNGDGQPLKCRLMGVELMLTPEQLEKVYVVLSWSTSGDDTHYQLTFHSKKLCEAYWGMQDSSLEAIQAGKTGSETLGGKTPLIFPMFSINFEDWLDLERTACKVYGSYEAHGEVVDYPSSNLLTFYTLYRNVGCDYCDDFYCVLDELDEEWAAGITEEDLWIPTADEVRQILTMIDPNAEPTYATLPGGVPIGDT